MQYVFANMNMQEVKHCMGWAIKFNMMKARGNSYSSNSEKFMALDTATQPFLKIRDDNRLRNNEIKEIMT